MPFEKVGDDDYVGPSGKHFNLAQVRLYYSQGGTFDAGDAAAELGKPTIDAHPHRNLKGFLHPKGASMPIPAADAYSQRRHAQIHALDDHDGSRGPGPAAAGTGVDSTVVETPDAEVPGSIPPAYETGNGQLEMNSRCALCGTPLSTHDLPAGKGTHCADCAKSMAEAPGAGSDVELGGPGSGPHGGGGKGPHYVHGQGVRGVVHNVGEFLKQTPTSGEDNNRRPKGGDD